MPKAIFFLYAEHNIRLLLSYYVYVRKLWLLNWLFFDIAFTWHDHICNIK